MTSESSMAFHPESWDKAVANGSADFSYYEWNSTSRASAAQHIKSDTRPQPKRSKRWNSIRRFGW